jgi:hypothetical protein
VAPFFRYAGLSAAPGGSAGGRVPPSAAPCFYAPWQALGLFYRGLPRPLYPAAQGSLREDPWGSRAPGGRNSPGVPPAVPSIGQHWPMARPGRPPKIFAPLGSPPASGGSRRGLAGFGAVWLGGGWSGHIGVGGRQTVAHEERICDLGGELGGVALVWLSAILEGDREAV